MGAAGVEEIDEVEGRAIDGYEDSGGIKDRRFREIGDGEIAVGLELSVSAGEGTGLMGSVVL